MPYRNIVFIKLEKRLLNDPRWWTMSSYAQLIHIKLMLLAAETYNKIPLNDNVLRQAMRSELGESEFKKYLNEVFRNFPKYKRNRYFRYIEEFETKTNWVNPKELRRNSKGTLKVAVDQDQDQDQDKDQEVEGGLFTKDQEKRIKSKIAEKNHHSINGEANTAAFESLMESLAKDKEIKNPFAVALYRIENEVTP